MMDELSGLTRRELICEVVRHRLRRDELRRQLDRIETLLGGTDASGWAKARSLVEEANAALDMDDVPQNPAQADRAGSLRAPI